MKIALEKAVGNYNHRILVGYADTDFSRHLENKTAGAVVAGRVQKEKWTTVLLDEDGITCVQILKKEVKQDFQVLENARKAAHDLYSELKDKDADNILLVNTGVSRDELLAFTEGLFLSNYRFTKYFRKNNKNTFSIKKLGVLSTEIDGKDIQILTACLEGVAFSRDLVNEPLSYLTAVKLAEEISEKGKTAGFSVEVFNKKKIEALKMGGLLAVNKGSIDPPTFTVMEWKPAGAVNNKPYVLVGKGIVYDTGGLSLKPTHDSMDYMKCDMSGAAAVAGLFFSIAQAGIPVHVIGLIPATDNRPDGNAYVPGDVITMYDGSTVEVLNTDAEGRMVLADALSFAKQYDPELVIELSTLTGAAHAAVGKYAIVGMGNAAKEVMEELKGSGFRTFERIAEFPFWDDFSELLKSDIADQKNIGGKYAGAITAGKFLEKFTDYPFIHLDIAGPSFNKVQDSYRGIGGSGVGVRLLFDFLKHKTV